MRTIVEHHTIPPASELSALRRAMRDEHFLAYVAISEAHRSILMQLGLRGDKIVAAHSGVDLRRYTQCDNERLHGALRGAASRHPLVVYAGSFYPGRGLETLLMAAQQVSTADFLLIGGAEDEIERYDAMAQQINVTNVRFQPRVRAQMVPELLERADVLVLPYTPSAQARDGTITARYASPLKMVEYMAAGKPIVAADVGAFCEVIQDGVNAVLVLPQDPDSLAAAIRRVVEDPVLSAKIGAQARKDATQFSWEARVQRVLLFASRVVAQ